MTTIYDPNLTYITYTEESNLEDQQINVSGTL